MKEIRVPLFVYLYSLRIVIQLKPDVSQGKSYSDWTDKQNDRQTIEFYNIDFNLNGIRYFNISGKYPIMII